MLTRCATREHNTTMQEESKCRASALQCIDPHSVLKPLEDSQPTEESFHIVLVLLLYFPTPVPLLLHRSTGAPTKRPDFAFNKPLSLALFWKTATLKPFSALSLSLSLFSRPEWVLFQAITWTAYQLAVMEQGSLLIKTWGGERLSGDALKISVGMY